MTIVMQLWVSFQKHNLLLNTNSAQQLKQLYHFAIGAQNDKTTF